MAKRHVQSVLSALKSVWRSVFFFFSEKIKKNIRSFNKSIVITEVHNHLLWPIYPNPIYSSSNFQDPYCLAVPYNDVPCSLCRQVTRNVKPIVPQYGKFHQTSSVFC